jgi:cyclin-dependent kinase 8/11
VKESTVPRFGLLPPRRQIDATLSRARRNAASIASTTGLFPSLPRHCIHNERMAPNYVSSPANTSTPSDVPSSRDTDLLRVARSQIPRSSSPNEVMQSYRAYRDTIRQSVLSTYNILGFLSSGTYGRVYKASLKGHLKTWAPEDERSGVVFAIKKFKPDKEEHATYTGISQSAMREIALNRELRHENIITLREVTLEDKSIYMIFHYASHDLLQVIHHHSTVLRTPIALPVLKSLLFQLLNGIHYLHSHFVLHRDLKPANILLTREGVVKIADLGLARIYQAPLQSLYAGDKVVVTIWYRAPELLLGARHYNYKIDMWAVGCIWGELLALRPMFKGEEAKMDPKNKTTLFQT